MNTLYSSRHALNITADLMLVQFHSQNQRAKAGLMAFRSRNFHAIYLAVGSFVFAEDAAEPHSLKLLKSSTKEQRSKRINKKLNKHFLD